MQRTMLSKPAEAMFQSKMCKRFEKVSNTTGCFGWCGVTTKVSNLFQGGVTAQINLLRKPFSSTCIWCYGKFLEVVSRQTAPLKKRFPFSWRLRTKFFWRSTVPACNFFQAPNDFSVKSNVKNLVLEHRKVSKYPKPSERVLEEKEAIKNRREMAKLDSDLQGSILILNFLVNSRMAREQLNCSCLYQMVHLLKASDWTCLSYHSSHKERVNYSGTHSVMRSAERICMR